MIISIVYAIISDSIDFRIWDLIFTYSNINISSIHDIIFVTLIVSKEIFGAFPTPMMSFLPCFPMALYLEKYKIFSTLLTHNIPYELLVSFNHVSNILNPQGFGVPYCFTKKKNMSNPMPLVFPMCFFNTHVIVYCYFVKPCQHNRLFVLPYLSSSHLVYYIIGVV